MKVLAVLVVLVGLALCAPTQENGVYVLNGDNFDDFVSSQDFTLVEFYAPWCGHCKHLAPEYEAAAQELGSKVALAKVDATENQELAGLFHVEGFPTLFWFTKGNPQPSPYGGGRTKDTIISWINRQTSTDLPKLTSQKELDDKLASGATVVVQFGGETQPALIQFARSVEYVQVYQVPTENLFGDYKGVVIFRANSDPVSSDETFTEKSLAEWIDKNGFPPVVEFSQDVVQRLQNRPVVIFAVDSYADGKKDSLVETLTTVANERPEFGWVYADSAVLGRGVVSAGASGNVYPTCVAVSFATGQQLAFDESLEFNSANLLKWVDGILTGETKPFKKSEPLPNNNNGGVKVLVAKNFADFVNSSKPAFVKYYAPWCGHCKTLAPIWDELGDAFKDANVVIGKIDATANFVEVEIRGFPTLLWHGTDGSVEAYDGGRDLSSLKTFVSSKIGGHTHDHSEL